ncbi:MAG: hypothetical protein Fur0041_07690 [Bacteroidia bacterium]
MNTELKHQADISHFEQLVSARLKIQGDRQHHMEVVAEHNGVSWINHSMATSIDLTWLALRDVPSKTVLILGGIDRSDEQEKLKGLVAEKVAAVICLGSTPWKYFRAFGNTSTLLIQASDLQDAINNAAILASGEVKSVLFAPGCPSYDAFDNYKNRGNRFREMVIQKFNSK